MASNLLGLVQGYRNCRLRLHQQPFMQFSYLEGAPGRSLEDLFLEERILLGP